MVTTLRMTILLAASASGLPAQEHRVELPAPRDPVPTVRILPVGDLALDPARPDLPVAMTLREIAAFGARFVQPPLRGQEELKSLGGRTLIGLLRPVQHAWLKRFVTENQKQESLMVDVQCRFVRMKKETFLRLAAPLLVDRGKKRRYALLAKGEKTANYLAGLSKVKGATVVHAPRLLALSVQRAHLSIMRQTTYVKDFEAKFDEGGKPTSIEPVIGIAQDGMWLRSTCGFVEDGMLGLVLQAHWSELKRPIKEVELRVKGLDSTLNIGVPELEVAEIETDVRMPDGGTALFELGEFHGLHQLVYVTVTTVDPGRAPQTGSRK